jgi:serine/threonine protein kinase
MAEALTKAGRYQIVSELGRGSMGVVYQGFDPVIGRTVAIKTMLLEGLPSSEFEEYKARFQREAQAAGVLTHPNIVTVYDFGEDNGVLYLAMEFLEGKSIQQIVEKHTVMPIETIVPLFEQICSALDHAHQNRIVHRDVKPANIMILDSGLVKVTDFGIAKLLSMGMTQAGQVLGTPNYMSPEQVKGRQIDGRSDIFSLGVILYELITGERPFGGQNITTVIYKIINENPISPRELDSSIHPGLCYVISKALAKDPEERYQTCRELADDLRDYKNLGGMAAPSATVVIKVPPFQTQVPSESPARPSYAQKPAARPAEPAYAPPPPAPKYSPEVGEVRPAPPVEPRRTQPAATPPVREDRPPSRPAPRPSVPLAQPQAGSGSPLPWIILAVLLIAIVAGGGYYLLQQQNKDHTNLSENTQQPASNTPAASSTQNPAPTTETQKPVASTANAPSGTVTPPPAAETTPPTPAPVTKIETPVAPAAASRGGKLMVDSNVRGAHITVDGQTDPGWVTPHTFADLSPGRHEILVAMDGYSSASQRVMVNGRNTSTARLRLTEAAPATPPSPSPAQPAPEPAASDNATIIIETKPAAYAVLVDGKPVGTSPARSTITPGDHTYTIKCPNGDVTKAFSITSGKLRSVLVACAE